MTAINPREISRLQIQARLDGLKSAAERNRLGQFATPTLLATDILTYARSIWEADRPVRFLDPAIGTGSFYSALRAVFSESEIADALGYEIDPQYGQHATTLWRDTQLRLHIADFTQAPPPRSITDKTTLLICNPPYVRHHHLSAADKERLQYLVYERTRIRINGLAGLYCYFLLLCDPWLADGALAGWLIPSEFMDVNYGQQLKHYLLDRVTLVRVHRFDPNDVQFSDALVSSAVVWYRKAKPDPLHTVEFTYGGSLGSPKISRHIPLRDLSTATKWTRFPAAAPLGCGSEVLRISDLFDVKRGVATGSNEFFILTPEQIREHQLPTEFLSPILPSPRYLTVDEVEADERGLPILDRRLFHLRCDLPEDEVKRRYPTLWRYLQWGVEHGVRRRYLCAHREIWYAQEYRPPAMFLSTYMGRPRAKSLNGNPFRFILNHSNATAANVYLMLYPKPPFERALRADRQARRAVWNALSSIRPETLVGEGRVYGGGLYKMEPKELASAPAQIVVEAAPNVFSLRTHPLQPALF